MELVGSAMEIKTTREKAAPEAAAPPEKSRYLRRPAQQKVRKSPGPSRLVVRALRLFGKLVVLALVAALLVSLGVFTFTSGRLSLRDVTIQGCNRADAQKLAAVVRDNFPSQMLRIDLNRVRARLEQEPWVRRAEIRRVLPSDLVVYVEERVPAVVLEIPGELMIADAEGILLDRYDPKFGKLDVPVFKGVLGENPGSYRMYQQENSDRIKLGLKLLTELESGSSAFTSEVSEVDVSDKTNVKILLVDEAAEILMGDHDFLKRFRTLMSNMTQYREIKTQYEEISSVDLRNEGQIVFRTRQAEATEAQP